METPTSEVIPQGFSAGWIIRTTLSVWRRNALPLIAASLVFAVPSVPIVLARGPSSRAYVVANGLLGLFASGAICAGVVTALRGSRPRVGQMTTAAIRHSGSLLLASGPSALAVILGLLLLVVPGAVIWAALFVVVPVIVTEPVGPLEALDRSWKLTRGRRLPIFWAALASLLALLVTGLLVEFAVDLVFGDASRVGSVVSDLLLAPIFGVYCSVSGTAYHALCLEKESVVPAKPVTVLETTTAAAHLDPWKWK